MLEAVMAESCHLVHAATLEEAVRLAAELGQPGDRVLLSPACASFDMFKNFEQRGEAFVQAVEALPA
jgi:UDP-N-acetylmuramoylalanine--D-glutamate ligase